MEAGVIGDDLFIESMREECGSNNITKDKPLEISLTRLLETVADWDKISVEAFPILGNDRRASRIRAVTAYLARSTQGVSLKEVAALCKRADNSMSQVATSLGAQMLKSERLKCEVGDLKGKLILAVRNSSDAPNRKYEA